MEVFLLSQARRQLEEISKAPCLAWFVGWQSDSRVEILNICRFLSKDGEVLRTTDTPYSVQQELDALELSLPYGLVPLGCAAVFGDSIAMSVLQLVESLVKLSKVAVEKRGGDVSIAGLWCVGELLIHMNGKGTNFEDITPDRSHFCTQHTSLRWSFDVTVPMVKDNDKKPDLHKPLHRLVHRLETPHSLLLLQTKSGKKTIARDTMETMAIAFKGEDDVTCTLYFNEAITWKRPMIRLHKTTKDLHCVHIHCDLQCYVPHALPVDEIKEMILVPTLERKCHHLIAAFEREDCPNEGYLMPVSVIYPYLPESKPDESTHVDLRRCLHRRFIQKEDRPIFRLSCAKGLVSDIPSDKLLNIHTFLPNKTFPEGGMMATVSGTYAYCHYSHDNFDDIGWGCAYRSLQTVFSWFIHQRYTECPIPSHKSKFHIPTCFCHLPLRKIQEVLVETGDKEGQFYGSREWIGSIEVGQVLQEMLGVSYSIVSKSAHQDVSVVARQLVHHFKTHGTPISIGGGVLAYTLLGIYFNDQTAEVELLILDPHYKGKDDPMAIVEGGWVAWKKPTDKAAAGGQLFAQNTHYNFMCCTPPNMM